MSTLIVYATKYGCTEKCAKILAQKLTGNIEVYNLASSKISELSKYDKIIVGGSIYAGRIQKEVTEFCTKNLDSLLQKEIGLFICGMLQEQAETELNNAFSPEILHQAVIKEFFGGELKIQKINFLEKFMVKMISKMDQKMPVLDVHKDSSNLSEERINRFAQVMNNFAMIK